MAEDKKEVTQDTVETQDIDTVLKKLEETEAKLSSAEEAKSNAEKTASKQANRAFQLEQAVGNTSAIGDEIKALQEQHRLTQAQILQMAEGLGLEVKKAEAPLPQTGVKAPAVPKDVQGFLDYMHAQGLDEDDEIVKEAVKDHSPKEALKALKEKINGNNITQIAEKLQGLSSKQIKDELAKHGLTEVETSSSTTGSAENPSIDELDKMTPAQYAKWRTKNK